MKSGVKAGKKVWCKDLIWDEWAGEFRHYHKDSPSGFYDSAEDDWKFCPFCGKRKP